MDLAKKIVDEIIDDLTGRQGLDDVWMWLEDKEQDEIKATWANIINENMQEMYKVK